MERQGDHNQAHIFTFPFTAQGHINPNLQFCKRLVAKGIKVTLITTISIGDTISPFNKSDQELGCDLSGINIEFIADGFDDAKKFAAQIADDIYMHAELFETNVKQSFIKFLETTREWECPRKVIVYDLGLPWVQEVINQFGLYGAAYFTASGAEANLFHLANEGVVKIPVAGQLSVPGMPLLESKDVPSFLHEVSGYPIILKALLREFDNVSRAKWVFIYSCDQLEGEVIKSVATYDNRTNNSINVLRQTTEDRQGLWPVGKYVKKMRKCLIL